MFWETLANEWEGSRLTVWTVRAGGGPQTDHFRVLDSFLMLSYSGHSTQPRFRGRLPCMLNRKNRLQGAKKALLWNEQQHKQNIFEGKAGVGSGGWGREARLSSE